jgi:phage/plasmid-like protein (TIGR03299 family)
MSHELGTFYLDGVECRTFAWLEGGAPPWHGLGQTVPRDASGNEWMRQAGLDYRVECRSNCRADGSPIESSYHIVRTDTGGIVGPYVAGQYQPFQNEDAMALALMICSVYGFRLDTAGVLFDGAKAFLQVQTDSAAELPGGDELRNGIVIAPAHDGRTATRLLSTNVRVVCNNTLSMALASASDTATFHHRVPFDAESVAESVGLNRERFHTFTARAHQMASVILTHDERTDFFESVLGGTSKVTDNGVRVPPVAVRRAVAFAEGRDFVAEGKDKADVIRLVDEALDRARRSSSVDSQIVADDIAAPGVTINPGHDLESAGPSLWGAVNTLTWMAEQNPTKNTGEGNAIASSMLDIGTGAAIKRKAWSKALELLAA